MKVEDLNPGDTFYYCRSINNVVLSRTYVSVHQRNPGYHIFLNESGNPVKMYVNDVENLLADSYRTYKEAEIFLGKALYYNFIRMAHETPELMEFYKTERKTHSSL